MGAEIRSKFLTILPVTPYYIAVVSNPEEMKIDEFKMTLPLRVYIAAKVQAEGLCKDLAKRRNSHGRR